MGLLIKNYHTEAYLFIVAEPSSFKKQASYTIKQRIIFKLLSRRQASRGNTKRNPNRENAIFQSQGPSEHLRTRLHTIRLK